HRDNVNVAVIPAECQAHTSYDDGPNPEGEAVRDVQTRLPNRDRITRPVVMDRRQLPSSERPVAPAQIESLSGAHWNLVYPSQLEILGMVEFGDRPLQPSVVVILHSGVVSSGSVGVHIAECLGPR